MLFRAQQSWDIKELVALLFMDPKRSYSNKSKKLVAKNIGCTVESAGWYIRNARLKVRYGNKPRLRIKCGTRLVDKVLNDS